MLNQLVGTEALIPVEVRSTAEAFLVPRVVEFNIEYYQVDRGQKRLVRSFIEFSDFCNTATSELARRDFASRGITACKSADYNYTVEFTLTPLPWLDLLNLFEFSVDVYLSLFVVIGGFLIGIGSLIWFVHLLGTRLKRAPTFRFSDLWTIVTPAPFFGAVYASIPAMTALGFVFVWFIHSASNEPVQNPSAIALEGIPGDWLDIAVLDADRVNNYRQGRVGTALLCFGLYVVTQGVKMFIPSHQGDRWKKDDAIYTADDRTGLEIEQDEGA